MGEQNVTEAEDEREYRAFMKKILDDVRALELMHEKGMFERGIRRIGAEQEMFLVDAAGNPAPLAMDMLDRLGDDRFTTELALFNLEANLSPLELKGDCLKVMEQELDEVYTLAAETAEAMDSGVVLTGILPTLTLESLSLDNMTPLPRYHRLNQIMRTLRGGSFKTYIKGLDELQATHDNILLEACNTSFQLHFQVAPEDFAPLYNLAQAITAPVLAAAVNSPMLLHHRLWMETRIALFQQSVDARSDTMAERGRRTRVSFGDRWVEDSVVEIFKDDIARMRVVISTKIDEDSVAMVERGEAPGLNALRLHNGTIYRWNRPCYGVADGVAHLRIENRALPSGPTPVDEVANAAFYFGLMSSLDEEYGDIREVMEFDQAKENFIQAARHGLMDQFSWVGGETCQAGELIIDHLLPLARKGLTRKGIDVADITRYLGIVEARVKSQQTGARWAMRSVANMNGQGTRHERSRALVQATRELQKTGSPVHTWPLATVDESQGKWQSYQYVSQVMTTDLVTLRPTDIVDLAASMMDWEKIRHIPVEDDEGRLLGLMTHRSLFRLVGRQSDEPVAVSEIMRKDILTVHREMRTAEALRLMRAHKVGCLPVVDGDERLIGLVTESDLLDVAATLLEEHLEGG